MLHPQKSQIVRRSAAPSRLIPDSRRFLDRPVDTGRLRTILQSGAYAALLNLEERAEKSRDALRAGNDIAAAAIGREILALANLAARGLNMLNDVRP